jgi:hypothetical protein
MHANFANPLILPLAMYRYWVGVFFSPAAKAADAAIDAPTSMPVEIANSTEQMKRRGRRPPYISARIHKAQQNAR